MYKWYRIIITFRVQAQYQPKPGLLLVKIWFLLSFQTPSLLQFRECSKKMRRALITVWLLVEVILVIILCIIPLGRSQDLSGNWLAFVPLFSNLLLDLICDFQLFVILCIDGGSVLRAGIWTLSVHRGGIVHSEEELAELRVGDSLRVEDNQHGLGMTGFA